MRARLVIVVLLLYFTNIYACILAENESDCNSTHQRFLTSPMLAHQLPNAIFQENILKYLTLTDILNFTATGPVVYTYISGYELADYNQCNAYFGKNFRIPRGDEYQPTQPFLDIPKSMKAWAKDLATKSIKLEKKFLTSFFLSQLVELNDISYQEQYCYEFFGNLYEKRLVFTDSQRCFMGPFKSNTLHLISLSKILIFEASKSKSLTIILLKPDIKHAISILKSIKYSKVRTLNFHANYHFFARSNKDNWEFIDTLNATRISKLAYYACDSGGSIVCLDSYNIDNNLINLAHLLEKTPYINSLKLDRWGINDTFTETFFYLLSRTTITSIKISDILYYMAAQNLPKMADHILAYRSIKKLIFNYHAENSEQYNFYESDAFKDTTQRLRSADIEVILRLKSESIK